MSFPHRVSTAFVLLALAGSAATALADDIHLTNGGKLEGKARRIGDEVVVESATGEVRLPAKDVKSIDVGPTKHLREVIALDADRADARARLGFVKYDGRWMNDAEYHEARGFVRSGNEWVSKDEIARREIDRRAREAVQTHTKRIRDCVAKMSSPRRKVRLDGRVALQDYAEKIGDPSLAQFASDVASYYNESWRAVKAEWEGGGGGGGVGVGTATVEVRATKAELKRPIPEISTSLGGFSTPVRIQLPEMSIVSIRTTARVPITIELDE